MKHDCPQHGEFNLAYVLCPVCVDREQRCHAVRCKRKIPARHFMCAKHWAMLPEAEGNRLGELFEGVEWYTLEVSNAFARQAMRCKLLVAEREGIAVDVTATMSYRIKKESVKDE